MDGDRLACALTRTHAEQQHHTLAERSDPDGQRHRDTQVDPFVLFFPKKAKRKTRGIPKITKVFFRNKEQLILFLFFIFFASDNRKRAVSPE